MKGEVWGVSEVWRVRCGDEVWRVRCGGEVWRVRCGGEVCRNVVLSHMCVLASNCLCHLL